MGKSLCIRVLVLASAGTAPHATRPGLGDVLFRFSGGADFAGCEPDFELALSKPVVVVFGVAPGDSLFHFGVLEPDVCVSFVVTRRDVPVELAGCLLAGGCDVDMVTR